MKKIVSVPLYLVVLAGLITGGYYLIGPILSPSFNHTAVKNTLLIDSDDDFLKYNFSGSGTPEDPFIIENRILGANETFIKNWYIGLEVINTTQFFVVRNCDFFGGLSSIRIVNVANGTANISNNRFYAIMQAEWDNILGTSGIDIKNANGVVIAHNLFTAADKSEDTGLIQIINSENSVLADNVFEYHRVDIVDSRNITIIRNFAESDEFCYILNSLNTSIIENKCYNYGESIYCSSCSNIIIENNTFDTIRWSQSLVIRNSYNITIRGNNITRYSTDIKNPGTGIILLNCNFTTISNNLVVNYFTYAVFLDELTHNVTIFNNNFYNNTGNESYGSISQGYDEGFGNLWFNPSLLVGNYWNDLGSNTTYVIAGSAGSVDLYPLSDPD